MAFTHTKKVYIGSFIKARIRVRIRPKRSGSGSATLPSANINRLKIAGDPACAEAWWKVFLHGACAGQGGKLSEDLSADIYPGKKKVPLCRYCMEPKLAKEGNFLRTFQQIFTQVPKKNAFLYGDYEVYAAMEENFLRAFQEIFTQVRRRMFFYKEIMQPRRRTSFGPFSSYLLW
jgi:hypothetical protein